MPVKRIAGYTVLQIALHWGNAVLVLCQLLSGAVMFPSVKQVNSAHCKHMGSHQLQDFE